jgi:phosphoglycolate phosphatase
MLTSVCNRLRVEPGQTVVVGDTVADMGMARSAGAGLAVAVLTGMGVPTRLADHADVVLESIHEISIAE